MWPCQARRLDSSGGARRALLRHGGASERCCNAERLCGLGAARGVQWHRCCRARRARVHLEITVRTHAVLSFSGTRPQKADPTRGAPAAMPAATSTISVPQAPHRPIVIAARGRREGPSLRALRASGASPSPADRQQQDPVPLGVHPGYTRIEGTARAPRPRRPRFFFSAAGGTTARVAGGVTVSIPGRSLAVAWAVRARQGACARAAFPTHRAEKLSRPGDATRSHSCGLHNAAPGREIDGAIRRVCARQSPLVRARPPRPPASSFEHRRLQIAWGGGLPPRSAPKACRCRGLARACFEWAGTLQP